MPALARLSLVYAMQRVLRLQGVASKCPLPFLGSFSVLRSVSPMGRLINGALPSPHPGCQASAFPGAPTLLAPEPLTRRPHPSAPAASHAFSECLPPTCHQVSCHARLSAIPLKMGFCRHLCGSAFSAVTNSSKISVAYNQRHFPIYL